MEFKATVYIIMTIFFLLSCSTKEKNEVGQKKGLVDIQVEEGVKNLTDQLLLSEAVKDIEIIQLETSDKSLFNKLGNITIGKEDVFIATGKTILRFDRNTGKFLNIVAKFGQGPSDVLYCSGVGIDESLKLVYTLANPFAQNDLKSFTYDGVWKRTVKVVESGVWMEAGSTSDANRLYCYYKGMHIFRRMLPVQDGSKDLWQIGVVDTSGKFLLKVMDPTCVEHQKDLVSDNRMQRLTAETLFSSAPMLNRYGGDVNYLFEANDTIYSYDDEKGELKMRYVLRCGERPDFYSMHKAGKTSDYFNGIYVSDVLETKDFLYLVANQDVYSYLLHVNKENGSIQAIRNKGEYKESRMLKTKYVDVEYPKFTNDLCGGLPFYPFDQNENSWIAKYEAADLLEQIDMDELKATEVLMPEKKEQLIRILENLKEDDNPVIMIVTLK